MKISYKYEQKQGYAFLYMISFLFIGISLCSCSFSKILIGLKMILTTPSVLLTDFSVIGNTGSAFFNSGVMMLFCLTLLKLHKKNFCESMISAIFAVGGFSFFGKNLYCLLPIIFGVFFYSKINRKDFSEFILVGFFGSALSPVVSHLSFSSNISYPYNIFLAYFVGIIIGIILPPLTTWMICFHKGNSLYTVGFSAGLLGIGILNIFKLLGMEPRVTKVTVSDGSFFFKVTLIVVIFIIFLYGIMMTNGFARIRANDMINQTYSKKEETISQNLGIALINKSLIGFILICVLFILKIEINGVVFGTVIAVIGYSARGIKFETMIPILLGGIATFFFIPSFTSDRVEVIMAILFSVGLSPIVVNYGRSWGFLAGIFHVLLAPSLCELHGGLSLYNSGLASGVVASLLISFIEKFRLIYSLRINDN